MKEEGKLSEEAFGQDVPCFWEEDDDDDDDCSVDLEDEDDEFDEDLLSEEFNK